MPEAPDVVVTGMGAVSAIGRDCLELEQALELGESGIGPIRRFDTSPFQVRTGAEVRAWTDLARGDPTPSVGDLCRAFALRAAREAMGQAGLDDASTERPTVGLVFGTSLGDLDRPVHRLAEELADGLGADGPRVTLCTACSSSTAAVGLARDMVRAHRVDVVLAGGADVLSERVFAGFHALGVLSRNRCAPFSLPFGTTLGEGAGFLVLEGADRARSRGVEPLVAISGYGLSGDGYHETSPEPRGTGVERALRAALVDAGLDGSQLGYVNAHGSGTAANDPAEWQGIQRGLAGGDTTVPVSSSKGALGHAQGAAGVLEAIVTILMMRRDLLPPTLNFAGPRAFAPADPIAGPSPRPARYRHAVCLNSAFGGANAAVAISRIEPAYRDAHETRTVECVTPREPEPVHVLGLGSVGHQGLGFAAWRRSAGETSGPRVPPFSLADVNPRLDPRGLDPSSRFLTAAAALALRDAGEQSTPRVHPDTGLVLGTLRPSPESLGLFGRSIEERGLEQVSAAAFARIVLNAPAGFCSKLLCLRGPLSVLTVGAGSGLGAIVLAAELLRAREDVRLMLGAAVDELGTHEEEAAIPAGEGAACVVLGRRSATTAGAITPRLRGWGIAGPGRLTEAVEQARAGIASGEGDVDACFDETRYAGSAREAWALPSALAFMAAASALRRCEARRTLVTSDLGRSMSLAVLLEV